MKVDVFVWALAYAYGVFSKFDFFHPFIIHHSSSIIHKKSLIFCFFLYIVRFFVPQLMDHPEEADKETFLTLMLKTRPEYAIVWDVSGKDVKEFYRRVYVAQYVVIDGDTVYYSQSRHYANRAKALFADTVQQFARSCC